MAHSSRVVVFVVVVDVINTSSPIDQGTGYCFRSISLFVYIYLSFFLSLFVSLFVSVFLC